jgi:hypothetical protein
MFDYFVATIISDQQVKFKTFCHVSLSSALIEAEATFASEAGSLLLNVQPCTSPSICIVEPVRSRTGSSSYSARDHLMLGGTLVLVHDTIEYTVTPDIFDTPIFKETEDEEHQKEIVGSCTIKKMCGTETTTSFDLEEIDYSHVIDHLLGRFFEFVAKNTYEKWTSERTGRK